ncbi:MAG: N-acetylmuramoyl-L-alanine amidase [Lysinibacillus fusiformis]|uniref:peptidoglycan recognition protein family protein n=1 Tax=Lysinibacillus fusiformis TaxID=28031 RepID=UPI00124674F8|nr:N-acetylmuramoyl-L-alanine amidase [Lysinibacillus fusiformis]KAB0443450.1 N-acetylmuramoyl-L-alanine amidase [Lysinibacillus fusiformis]MCT6926802.1 N-acetylmuramoyl-L-alanine amidase [Lysinibacillus fusiformis]MCT6931139.1 N-acetylmuramoyl-L-alanine amidase [Lysinibacillus fusiformis]
MTYPIEKRFMAGLPNYALTSVKYVIAHESGNRNNCGPNALENEIAYMNRNKANAFTSHWVGGGGRIVQIAPVNRVQYGCGPKGNPLSYAQVELARTNDKEQFKKDYAAYIWFLRELAKEAYIPVVLDGTGNGIKSHRWITDNLKGTTHRDPYSYLSSMGISEAQFKNDIKNGIEVEDKKEEIKVAQPLLNDTGRTEIRALLKKARNKIYVADGKTKNVIDPVIHTDAKINAYTDEQLLSYQAAVINRTF